MRTQVNSQRAERRNTVIAQFLAWLPHGLAEQILEERKKWMAISKGNWKGKVYKDYRLHRFQDSATSSIYQHNDN